MHEASAWLWLYESLMSPQLQQASFIPKRPLVQIPNQKNAPRRRRRFGIFAIIAWILFILAGLAAAGVYVYDNALADEIEEKRIVLERETARIDEDFIDVIKTTNAQMTLADDVLRTHVSSVSLFEVINQVTLQTGQLTGVAFDAVPTSGSFILEVTGVVQSFEGLTRQADAYRTDDRIKKVEITDLSVLEDGNVGFSAELVMTTPVGRYVTRFPDPEPVPSPTDTMLDTDAINNPEFDDTGAEPLPVNDGPEPASEEPVEEPLLQDDPDVESPLGDILLEEDFSDFDSLFDF